MVAPSFAGPTHRIQRTGHWAGSSRVRDYRWHRPNDLERTHERPRRNVRTANSSFSRAPVARFFLIRLKMMLRASGWGGVRVYKLDPRDVEPFGNQGKQSFHQMVAESRIRFAHLAQFGSVKCDGASGRE